MKGLAQFKCIYVPPFMGKYSCIGLVIINDPRGYFMSWIQILVGDNKEIL